MEEKLKEYLIEICPENYAGRSFHYWDRHDFISHILVCYNIDYNGRKKYDFCASYTSENTILLTYFIENTDCKQFLELNTDSFINHKKKIALIRKKEFNLDQNPIFI